jgi:arginine decarboxylase
MARWTNAESEELYQIPAWGGGYFRVNDRGHLAMTPPSSASPPSGGPAPAPGDRAEQARSSSASSGIDLKTLVDDLQKRGISLPILLRFTDLIQARLDTLAAAFAAAKKEYEFRGGYRGVYPVKVNQNAYLVEAITRYSRPHHLGLEAGSKPELQVVLATLDDPEALIICNGYKDRDYIQMALLARKLGRNCIIVVEKMDEIDSILEVAAELGLDPVIGVRAKLSSKGSGRWQGSVGDRAKFGLTTNEIVEVVHRLRDANKLGILQLLHFHIGSQVTNIRSVNAALREATRTYVELRKMGCAMRYFDVGGGLGVDYDGSRTNFESSMNYDVHEYASAVISGIVAACDEAEIPHPDVITESGRAMVAHHSALIFDVVGATRIPEPAAPKAPPDDASEDLSELWSVWESITSKNLIEPYHDAQELREQSLTKFNLGLIALEERARVEALFWAVCHKIARTVGQDLGSDSVPEELQPLRKQLADTYYCNFSLFQSAPDSWAINQLFPICPIHRLGKEPTRRAVLADLTCDSDGKVDKFIDRRDVKPVLELHEPNGEPYYIGMFLLGAYQEILGDLHNLFGDTNQVHVSAVEGGSGYKIDHVIEGNTVMEVLDYVSYDRKRLLRNLRRGVEDAIGNGNLTMEEGALLVNTYVKGLEGYTYFETKGGPPAFRTDAP